MSAPRRIAMTVTFLEMRSKPSALPPPPKGKIAILRAEHPPVHFYRYLYDAIGRNYYWVERKRLDDDALAAILHDPRNALYILYADGTPSGLSELDLRVEGVANISYFGLIPEAIGRGLGYFLLYHTCMNAFAQPIQKLLVNTCTLDHPRALPLYQRMGFVPYAREERYVEVP